MAEASGAKTGFAPKQKKPSNMDGFGTIKGMRPEIKKSTRGTQQHPSRPTFGSAVYEACPPVPADKYGSSASAEVQKASSMNSPSSPVTKDENKKLNRNPAVNLVDGGASKDPPKMQHYRGTMMTPRIARPTAPKTQEEGK